MATILFVRVKSQLDDNELERRLIERRPRFHDVPGLVQNIKYGNYGTLLTN
jgi:hypothetical protein